eukprot:CAMPEP_0116857690 /NCGR_PEP_ID=MMETSP0418-20121206/20697_1 /TAXON_ID=1158023 /ORGANISM="Astrosyne radiata, Strain 13vi08-1A" /LENGTH=54 /DNA_ID=CAMNT_0004491409 /DNA_START=124 /DNA_END=285 /DNA_ORIENTATION=+
MVWLWLSKQVVESENASTSFVDNVSNFNGGTIGIAEMFLSDLDICLTDATSKAN